MKLPHSITLFNRYDDASTGRIYYIATVIDGVLFRLVKGEGKAQQGEINRNSAKLFIPITADAEGKTYVPPSEFAAGEPEENENRYTYAPDDFFVKGKHPEFKGAFVKTADVEEECETFRITAAEFLDFGASDLQHWEVVGE